MHRPGFCAFTQLPYGALSMHLSPAHTLLRRADWSRGVFLGIDVRGGGASRVKPVALVDGRRLPMLYQLSSRAEEVES